MEKRKGAWIIILIIIVAIITRLIFLDLRPLHHDEGVNYFFTNGIFETGSFKYDPLNYHGPSYFFILFLSLLMFGVSEFSLRLPAAIFGIFLVFFPLLFRLNSGYNKYLAAGFILLSPSIMYYSRYSIHESLFILVGLVAVYSLTKILENKNLESLPVFAIALAFLFVTKETAIIMAFVLFVICCVNYKHFWEIKFKENKNLILFSILLFILIYVLFFTSFFTNTGGLSDSVKGYLPWTERGLKEPGHIKPFYYYLLILIKYEFPLFLLSLFGIVFTFIYRRKDIFARNIVIWFVLIFFIYSLINYKTPWLIVNMSLPMAILSSIAVGFIKNRRLRNILLIISFAYLILTSVFVNFIMPGQPKTQSSHINIKSLFEPTNLYAYVHTYPDIFNLADDINKKYKEGNKILIVSDSYWPLPFYLHGERIEYLEEVDKISYRDYNNYDIYILKDSVFSNSDLPLGFSAKEYELREGVKLYLVYKND